MKKIYAIILAFSLLFSNVGLALSTHFCGGMPVDYELSFGMADLGCGMEKSIAICERSSKGSERLSEIPCCQNSHRLLQLEEASEKDQSSLLKLQEQTSFAVIAIFVVCVFSNDDAYYSFFTNYTPPPLLRDIPILFQTFRI